MAEEGADSLTRDFRAKFEDLKSLAQYGVKTLLKKADIDNRTIDLFASSIDNPLKLKYCHINWDQNDRKALGMDAFEFLDRLAAGWVTITLYAYFVVG